jgi:hypothetical protein
VSLFVGRRSQVLPRFGPGCETIVVAVLSDIAAGCARPVISKGVHELAAQIVDSVRFLGKRILETRVEIVDPEIPEEFGASALARHRTCADGTATGTLLYACAGPRAVCCALIGQVGLPYH